ncbi:helix-turn-helix transcriptional regulator [Paenibacillus sp. YPG26]|uniref:helix-turn-helix transcriptional regulator n=1 Tax=Paenibacillus sp. YPG26 TaxID=2878915 RepID=UPI00203F3B0D|nr:helix-turn-helix transcriptional regulator [Paenibacillus sp. YPG26]USB32299.1 PadR family transcriptional regulator [Paenibacillus sp. YPG26]
MVYVILGLLMIRRLSQYDIRRVLSQKVSPFYSASLGSIQAALKKLESQGYIECHDTTENGRKKKIYSIHPTGRQQFMDWMLTEVTPSRLEQEVTTRLFFLGLMTKTERLIILSQVIDQLEASVHEFEAASVEANQKEIPGHLEGIAAYQLKTLELGLFYHQSMLEWFTRLKKELEAEG